MEQAINQKIVKTHWLLVEYIDLKAGLVCCDRHAVLLLNTQKSI